MGVGAGALPATLAPAGAEEAVGAAVSVLAGVADGREEAVAAAAEGGGG